MISVAYFMALNLLLVMGPLIFFLSRPEPWAVWLSIPACIGALLIGVAIQVRVRNNEITNKDA